jgi:hypothetical protein
MWRRNGRLDGASCAGTVCWRRALVLAVALPALAVLSGCGRLDRDAVRTEVGKIESASAEGTLVAREAARGRAFLGFILIRSAELRSEAEKAQQKLSSTPAEDGWNDEASAATKLAGQIAVGLGALHQHPHDRHAAGQLAHKLGQIADKADQLSEKL